MGKKRDQLNAWEMALIESAVREFAQRYFFGRELEAATLIADKFLKAESATVTHG